jgi:predicted DNA-binding transcriptional regulator AlpA
MGDAKEKTERPSWLDLERVIPLPEVTAITSLSRDSLDRHHRDKYVRLGPRRIGIKMRNVIAIGEAKG